MPVAIFVSIRLMTFHILIWNETSMFWGLNLLFGKGAENTNSWSFKCQTSNGLQRGIQSVLNESKIPWALSCVQIWKCAIVTNWNAHYFCKFKILNFIWWNKLKLKKIFDIMLIRMNIKFKWSDTKHRRIKWRCISRFTWK